MEVIEKKRYKYTTDKGRVGAITLSTTKAAAGGFTEVGANENIPPLGIPVNRLRHSGVRMSDGSRYELPLPTKDSNLYETIGQTVNWTIAGTPKSGKTVGSTGEKIR